jgi:CubicO group peptidase (beta-lactamase class C family)
VTLKISRQVLDTHLHNAYYYYDLPGLGIGIGSAASGLEYAQAFGVKSVETREALQTQDIFHMASLAKLFTGTGIMQLWEKGQLDLDAPVTRYMEWFLMRDPNAREITVRQLLTHTSGMPDVQDYHWDEPQTDPMALRNYFQSDEIRNARLLWPPGEKKFSYSNIGYDLLGLIISEISGMTFEDYMAENIFHPLAMSDSTFFTPSRDDATICAPHMKNNANKAVVLKHYPYNRIHAPSSTLTSNLYDMAKWAAAALNQALLKPQTHQVMRQEFATVPNNGEKMCISWFAREQNGLRLYGHEGADEGFRSSLWICPDRDLFILLCANISNAPLKKISKEIFDMISASE